MKVMMGFKPTELLKAKYIRKWKRPDGTWGYAYPTEPKTVANGFDKIVSMFSGGTKSVRLPKAEAMSLLTSAVNEGKAARGGNIFYAELPDGRIIQSNIFQGKDHMILRVQG